MDQAGVRTAGERGEILAVCSSQVTARARSMKEGGKRYIKVVPFTAALAYRCPPCTNEKGAPTFKSYIQIPTSPCRKTKYISGLHLYLDGGRHQYLPTREANFCAHDTVGCLNSYRQQRKNLRCRSELCPCQCPRAKFPGRKSQLTLELLLPNPGRLLRVHCSPCRCRFLHGAPQDANKVRPKQPAPGVAPPPTATPGNVQRGFPLGVFSQRVRASGEQQAGRVRVSCGRGGVQGSVAALTGAVDGPSLKWSHRARTRECECLGWCCADGEDGGSVN